MVTRRLCYNFPKMRAIIIFGILSTALIAQTPTQNDLARLTRELRSAWLIRDARAQTDAILTWLPTDTGSFWVNQEPFSIKPEDSVALLQDPARAYSVDRLAALNDGSFYRALANRTVRMVMAATRGIRKPDSRMPGRIANQDVVYFYFFSEPPWAAIREFSRRSTPRAARATRLLAGWSTNRSLPSLPMASGFCSWNRPANIGLWAHR
jgi:type II secretory pathway pseudopilin PulG